MVPDVIGTAIGEQEGKPCIVIMVDRKSRELVEKIPEELEGYAVVIKETGEIRASYKDYFFIMNFSLALSLI